jgi:hypothetical protein
MTGDCHVRFCESLRRKPWATRPSSQTVLGSSVFHKVLVQFYLEKSVCTTSVHKSIAL